MAPKPSKPRAKFLCDENFPNTLAQFLRQTGVSVAPFPRRKRKQKLSDLDLLKFANKSNLILLTKDRDFLTQYATRVSTSAGVVCFEGVDLTKIGMHQLTATFFSVFSEQRIQGRVLHVTSSKGEYHDPQL